MTFSWSDLIWDYPVIEIHNSLPRFLWNSGSPASVTAKPVFRSRDTFVKQSKPLVQVIYFKLGLTVQYVVFWTRLGLENPIAVNTLYNPSIVMCVNVCWRENESADIYTDRHKCFPASPRQTCVQQTDIDLSVFALLHTTLNGFKRTESQKKTKLPFSTFFFFFFF